ncbi:SpaA isopeptide-forming pilin-related protein [Faecalibacterium prausnitzii]|uniref:SpaA isopeptide-forming pilin-related protein n=1 Tax=Faecalibacterium prausnitzii TaxID=853 RepID=UPI003F1DBE83
MKDIINGLIERFRRQHVQARRYVAMMLVLALLTTLFVNWQLHGVGISMTADYHCGYEEHQHTAACYEKVLTCGYEEGEPETPVTSSDSSADPVSAYSAAEPEEPEEPVQTEPETIWVPHEHTDACYEEHRVLTCYQEEHEHTDDCFDEYGALICGEFEHIHDDSCYTTEYELVCGLDEGELVEEPNPAYQEMPASRPVVDLPTEPAETTPDEPVLHHHTDACYTEELVCTIPEHHHTVECLADTQADVETAEEWQAAANVALNGNWAEDLLTVAKSQLDYQQSDKNFKLDVEDQQVLRGYSRYGAWYGNPYGAWDVMFLSYCLHFAGVPQTVVPQRAGVMALHSDLRGSQWLTDADGSTARPGDIVIYNTLTTEQVAVDESSYGIALLDLDEDPDTAAQLTASEPQVDTRTVTTETVGVVSAVDPDAGTLTVISGNVDGKVAEVPAAMSDVTSVISVTGAYAAETTAAAPEDPAGSQEKLDGSYALLEDEEGFGATVDWVGDADPYGIALLAAGDDHDLKTWITDVNYEKTTDGKTWTSIGAGSVTVDSGTHVRVNLKYTVKPGVLTPTHNTLTYQLPKGLPMPDVVTGNIVDESDKDKAGNAKVVGSFTVDTDGKVTLTFTDEKFIGTDEKGGLPFTGTFKAAVTASADNFEDEKEIKFKDDCILTIKKKTADIKISKGSGSPLITNRKDGTFVNNYEVTVGTTNGTKDPVILTDTLNTNRNGENRSDYLKGGKYLVDSFKLYKVDASGTKTEIDVPAHELKTDGNGNPQVVLAPLPALEAGEKYIWNYDVQRNYADFDKIPNGVAIINNTAKAEAGRNVKDAADAWYTCKTSRIEKKGEYDPKTGRIQWTITVKVPHSFLGSYLLQGCKITDDLPDGVKIVGDVKVGNDTISAENFLQNGYTIPAEYGETELKITFETTTPIGGGSVTNTAQIETKSKHTFEASDTVNIGKGDWSLSKSIATRGETPTWNLSATNKAGEAEFTLWDVLDDAENDQGEEKKDTHYAIAKELDDAIKANLTLTMLDNTKLTYAQADVAGNTIEMTYYADRDGTEQVNAGDSRTRVRSFSIHVKAGDDQNPVRSISVTGIPTHEERDDVPTGEVWTYKNTIHIQGVNGNDSAEDTYRSYKKFEKGVAAKSSGDETGYLTGSNTFEKNDLSGHKLRYQLVLQTDQDDADAIEVTDILPENVDFAINSVQISLDEDVFVKPDKLTTAKATAAYDPATRQLTVNIKDYNPDANKPHRIRIRYEVDVGTDTQFAWKNPSVGKLTYTNTATWGELTETTTTTVTRKVEQVKKTGWQDPGNDRKLHYQVVINPAGHDLSAGQTRAEKIELWDNISTTNGAIATGDVNSVKLYFYNYDETVGVTTGKEVPRNMYRILEADKNGWLHMEIPNMAALILVYDCNVKDGSAAASYQVSNTVTLSNGSKSSDSGITYQVKADATATTAQFVLRKKDSYSGVSLKGAEFTIFQYDTVSGRFVPWTGNGTLTTDENGQASLAVLDSETASCLKPDVLYKLVETKAPTDYQLDATPHYLLFRKNASAENEQQAFANATGVAEGTTILTVNDETVDLNRNVQVGSDAGTTTAEYSNVYSKLTVSKLWLDADTRQPVEPAVDSIHIKVWRYTDDPANNKTLFDEADLNADNHWTATWSGNDLPLKDPVSGKAYHYLVEEVTTGNWNVYIDNNGVQTGNITVQNYVYTGYELPSTGGMGTAPFGVLGGALAAAAALLLVRKRKQDEEE